MKKFVLLLLLTACGNGDGPPGHNTRSDHPNLASCDESSIYGWLGCSEYRNITDEGWARLNYGRPFCEAWSDDDTMVFTENGTCQTKPNGRGICRTVDDTGMTRTQWFYKCLDGAGSFRDCAKTPSVIQAECQEGGGTYIPPDAAG